MRKIIYIIAAVFALSSCVYDFDPVVVNEDPRLVIDGDIVIGGISKFSVYYSQPLDDLKPNPAVGELWIENNRKSTFVGGANKSYFEIDTKAARTADTYRVHFTDAKTGKKYVSTWQNVIPAPNVTDFSYDFDKKNVYTKITVDGGKNVRYFKWTYDETWEYTADYAPEYQYNKQTRQVEELSIPDQTYYNCYANTSSTEFGVATSEGHNTNILKDQLMAAIPRSSQKMTSMYRVDVTISGMTKDSYLYHKNMKEISNMTGSLFTPSPDDMRGNYSNVDDPTEFVIGYVNAVQKSTSRFYLDTRLDKLYIPTTPYSLTIPDFSKVPMSEYLNSDFVPVKMIPGEEGVESLGWGHVSCVDCRYHHNGFLEKPADWIY